MKRTSPLTGRGPRDATLPTEGISEAPVVLVAEGKQLATTNGCLACHTVNASDSVGPSWLGLFGSTEALEDGTTVEVDQEYLRESSVDPAAEVVDGFSDTMPKELRRATLRRRARPAS